MTVVPSQSMDHRGTPQCPGLVATLVSDADLEVKKHLFLFSIILSLPLLFLRMLMLLKYFVVVDFTVCVVAIVFAILTIYPYFLP